MKPTPKPTQIDKIKRDLLAGETVNNVTATTRHYITRLGSVIDRLKKRGWPIITTKNKGNGMANYSLPENWKPGGEYNADGDQCCHKDPLPINARNESAS